MKSKFVPLFETIFNRFQQGAGFLEGDVVKLKDNFKNTECFKSLSETIKARLEDAAYSGYNLRVGRLHTPNNQYGSFGHLNLPATHADLYQEKSPGNFGNLVTVPVELLQCVDTGVNLAPVSPNNKRTKNEAPYQKPSKASYNKDAKTDEQSDSAQAQTHAKGGNYDLATKDVKPSSVKTKSYDDSKPSKFKPLPHNKKVTKESVEALENVYTQILNEDVSEDTSFGNLDKPDEDAVESLDMNDAPKKEQIGKHEDTEAVQNYLVQHVDAVNNYVEDHGINGWDLLLSSSLEEVKELLDQYITDESTGDDATQVNPNPEDKEQSSAH